MLEELQRIAEQSYHDNPCLGTDRVIEMRARLAALDDGQPVGTKELLQIHNALGLLEHLETARELARTIPPQELPRSVERLTYNLAVACLVLGEDQNCVARHTSESCILPIQGGGVHVEKSGSRRAVRYLLEVLEQTPEGDDMALGARWLLNLAFMTLGEYPDGVPEQQRIPPSVFASEAEFPRFRDVAPELGLNVFTLAGGVASEDYDGDGRLDLFVTTWDTKGQARFQRNDGQGGFEDHTLAAGLEGILGGLNVSQADYDSDGDVDVLVLRGGWLLGNHGTHPKSLLQNRSADGAARFVDVTFLAGLGEVHYPTQTADWADHDLDGDLDLYVGSEANSTSRFPSQLFQNQGDGRFRDVGGTAGVQNLRFAKGVSWGDIDADRDQDLYVSNYQGQNRLYLNDGRGAFVDVAVERGVELPLDSFPCWFWDFDNDGALDIYVSTFYQSTDEARIGPVVASALGLPHVQGMNKLYRGDGRGNFRDVAPERGLDLFTVIMGASFGDLDNDGYPDMYLGTGYPFYDGLVPNVMYWNRRGERFCDVTTAGGFGHLQKGHGITFADLDGDGDQDVFEQMGGAYPGDAFGDLLFENPGFGNHWLKLRLVGTRSNRAGVGARVRAEISEQGRKRSVHRTVGQHGSFGNSPFEQHLGLGQATKVDLLEVYWPLTDEKQVFRDVPVDRSVRVTEGSNELDVRSVPATPFRK
jgi:hypothetical protein